MPRPNSNKAFCVPGTWGYQSAIPRSVAQNKPWVKSTKSPEWVSHEGKTKPNSQAFTDWLEQNIGHANTNQQIIVFGLTLDCCVLNVLLKLYLRGHKVSVLSDATDIDPPNAFIPLIKPNIDYSVINWEE